MDRHAQKNVFSKAVRTSKTKLKLACNFVLVSFGAILAVLHLPQTQSHARFSSDSWLALINVVVYLNIGCSLSKKEKKLGGGRGGTPSKNLNFNVAAKPPLGLERYRQYMR